MNDARFVRLAEQGRAQIRLLIDGLEAHAMEGDTLMVAILGASDEPGGPIVLAGIGGVFGSTP